jgi:beta-N-acetylhexosaminidase
MGECIVDGAGNVRVMTGAQKSGTPIFEDLARTERLAAELLMVGFPGYVVPKETADLIARGVRSFILFARNVADRDQLRSLTSELRRLAGDDVLIAIDHEGGRVNRLTRVATSWPAPMAWAATGDLDLARRASAVAAEELRALGINLSFAPVLDLLGDHHNPVLGTRCFSDDPMTAAAYGSAFVEGHRRHRVATTAKHFPGHGDTSVDSHLAMPRIDRSIAQLREADLPPFEAAIASGVDCMMISHVWYTALDDERRPATVSPHVVNLARDGLGYDGVIVTDSMEMGAIRAYAPTEEAVVQSIAAGIDLAVISHDIDLQRETLEALATAIQRGTIPMDRVMEAHRRLDRLRSQMLVNGETSVPDGGTQLGRKIAEGSITLVRDEEQYLPLQLTPGKTLGVVTFMPHRPTGVENPDETLSNLAHAARAIHPRVVEVKAADGGRVPSVLEALRDAETILVGTSFTTGHPFQGEIVEALLRDGKRVIVLALNDPFDLLSFPDAPCYLALYGNTSVQIDAALAVVFGGADACGRLPVALGDLYPRGHGILSRERD